MSLDDLIYIEKYHLKCNIKSLVAESRILRQEAKKVQYSELKNSLHGHRVGKVRRALRIANLAYACIRGVPYKKLEPNTKKLTKQEIDKLLNDVKSKACKFAFYAQRKDIEKWLEDAKQSLMA